MIDKNINLPAADENTAFETETEQGPALPPGVTEQALRRFLQARHAREIGAEIRLREHYVRLAQQAEALKAVYPDFDLAREMQNPDFVRLTAPGVDIDPGTAYEIIHRRDLQKDVRAAERRRISRAIQSGSYRPAENALAGSHASTPVHTDPRNLSTEDRKDIHRRVARGERVTF